MRGSRIRIPRTHGPVEGGGPPVLLNKLVLGFARFIVLSGGPAKEICQVVSKTIYQGS